jgi:hypothetical protein
VEQVESYVYWSEEAIMEAEEMIDAYSIYTLNWLMKPLKFLATSKMTFLPCQKIINEIASLMEQAQKLHRQPLTIETPLCKNAGQQVEQTQQAMQGFVDQAKKNGSSASQQHYPKLPLW